MANIVRGFRRIGWVATVPLAAFTILVFFENTKDYSASSYEVQPAGLDHEAIAKSFGGTTDSPTEDIVITMPGLGYAHFSKDVPRDIADKVVADFTANHGKTGDVQMQQHAVDNARPQKDWFAENAPMTPEQQRAVANAKARLQSQGDSGVVYSDVPKGFTVASTPPRGNEPASPPEFGSAHGPWEDFGGTPLTVADLGNKVKAKYPGAYDDLSDADVGRKTKAKYPGAYDDFVEVSAQKWQFTLHKRVNRLEFAGLVLAAWIIPSLVIQGLISITAWVVRGFGHQ